MLEARWGVEGNKRGSRDKAYVAVRGRDDDGANHHEPVRHRDVQLAVELGGGVDRLDLGKVARAHDLPQELEGACDDGL